MLSSTSKTTVLGIVTIVAAVANAALSFLKTGTIGDPGELLALLAGGYGLIKAADAK
jgi:hypothetical protein